MWLHISLRLLRPSVTTSIAAGAKKLVFIVHTFQPGSPFAGLV